MPYPIIAEILKMAGVCEESGIAGDTKRDIVQGLIRQCSSVVKPKALAMLQADLCEQRARLVDGVASLSFPPLRTETTHLAISIIDRFLLGGGTLSSRQLDLLVAAAVWIAVKFEEIHVPPIEQLLGALPMGRLTQQDVYDFEPVVLMRLDFCVARPTSAHILPLLLDVMLTWKTLGVSPTGCPLLVDFAPLRVKTQEDALRERTAWCLLELALLDWCMAQYTASVVACSVLLCTNRLFDVQPEWPMTLAQLSGHPRAELAACVLQLETQVKVARQHSDNRGVARRLRGLFGTGGFG